MKITKKHIKKAKQVDKEKRLGNFLGSVSAVLFLISFICDVSMDSFPFAFFDNPIILVLYIVAFLMIVYCKINFDNNELISVVFIIEAALVIFFVFYIIYSIVSCYAGPVGYSNFG